MEHHYRLSMSKLCNCTVSLITIALIFLLDGHFTIRMFIYSIPLISHSLDDNLYIIIIVDHYVDY